MLVDLRPFNVTGKAAETSLGKANITCNKNGIPYDPEKPTVTSGIRLGTPAATTRGFGPKEFRMVGQMICTVLEGLVDKRNNNAETEANVRKQVAQLCGHYPIYPGKRS